MTRKTLRQLEANLIALRADAAVYADRVKGDSGLTPEGQTRQMAGWGKQRRWDDQLATLEAQMHAALEAARTRAAAKRDEMAGITGTTEQRTLAELRHARRAGVLEAAISKGPAAVAQLIADARAEDVPLIVESVQDRAATSEKVAATGMLEGIEHGLRTRSPEYAAAAKTAGMVDSAQHIVTAQLEATRQAITDPHAKPPAEHGLAAMSVDVAGTDVGDLTP